jgi:DNA-binding NtrC family response regulator
LLNILSMATNKSEKEILKKILIVDEHGFSRVCAAILTSSGYKTDILPLVKDLSKKLDDDSIDLVVTSYPYGTAFFDSLRNKDIPVIILTDGIDERLMGILGDFQNSCCMIKPVDYDKFKSLVKRAVEGSYLPGGGYSIV